MRALCDQLAHVLVGVDENPKIDEVDSGGAALNDQAYAERASQ